MGRLREARAALRHDTMIRLAFIAMYSLGAGVCGAAAFDLYTQGRWLAVGLAFMCIECLALDALLLMEKAHTEGR